MWICTKSLPPSSFSLWRPGSHGHTQLPALRLHLSAVWSTQKSTPYLLCPLDTKWRGKRELGSYLTLFSVSGVVATLCPHPWMDAGKSSAKWAPPVPEESGWGPREPVPGFMQLNSSSVQKPNQCFVLLRHDENQLCHPKWLLANIFTCSNPCHH